MDFSVIIPCRNAEPWIGAALHSIRRQTLPPAEVIVIDDGSTDRSLQVVRASGLGNLRILHSTHRNGAATRNVGIAEARGRWIAFLDADDLWAPEHLARAEALLARSSDVAYQAHFNLTDLQGTLIERPVRWPCSEPTAGLGWQDYPWFLQTARMFGMSSVVIDRHRLIEVGMLDPSQVRRHDIDMWLRVIVNRTWSLDPVASSYYRVGVPGSISGAVADAEYYYLRALTRAEKHYSGSAMKNILQVAARSAISAAFTDGGRTDIARALALGWSRLSLKDQVLLGIAIRSPRTFRHLNRFRRRVLGLGQG